MKENKLSEQMPQPWMERSGMDSGCVRSLNHYRKKNSMPSGWLVFEDYGVYLSCVKEALSYLKKNKKKQDSLIEKFKEVGFSKITFLKN